MHSFKKQSIALLMAIMLFAAPLSAMAQSDGTQQALDDPQINALSMVGDAVVARPLGLVATVAGFGLFIVASPFALISGSAGDAWDAMVTYPAKFTFTRPLGEFE